MILTAYRCHTIEHRNTYWVIIEGIAGPEKKVVIHEYKDGILGWASQFADLDRALRFWDCLERNEFDPKYALKTFKLENDPE